MLAVLVSGVSFNLPEEYKALVGVFSPITPEAVAPTGPGPAALPGRLDAFVEAAARTPGNGTLNNLTLTAPDGRTVGMCFRAVADLAGYVVDTRCHTLDRQTGTLLRTTDPSRGSGGDVFMPWQWPLHSGQVFGWTGRILVFLSGLACPVLFVTGLQKRRARRAVAERRALLSD